jgi:hypothetical protein
VNVKQLRSLLPDDTDVDDLILAKSDLYILDSGYQELGFPTPEWVTDKLVVVTKEIIDRNRNELQRRLKAAKARRATLATPEEKRGLLDAEITALEQKLG